ncbi:MAG TPA: hypothetical protein VLF94_05860 [Chlamydiales bacterium]|nr:hypothetical protein [Chlamydiales bacterium]
MREWIEELSDWMEKQEELASPLTDLSEEVGQTVLETDSLLQSCDQLQSAYASLLGKVDHGSS